MKKLLLYLCNPLCFAFLSSVAFAQGNHYWSLQYGTRSTLLGGAVIGSVDDLGATFYNPGLFGLIEDPSFLLTARIYQNTQITIEDGAGEGRDIKKSKFGGAPSLAAGSFKFKWANGHHFAYSILTRNKGRFSFTTRGGAEGDLIPGYPGDELLAGEFRFSEDLEDTWNGLTWAFAIGDHIGLGLTQYLSILSQSRSERLLIEALGSDGTTASAINIEEYDYKLYRMLTKFGLGWRAGNLTAGLTVTTPGINISGSGSAGFNELVTGGDLTGDGNSDDLLQGELQRSVDAQTKSSWAVGFGAGYMAASKLRLHFSGEWYDKIEPFNVLKTEPFIGESTGDTLTHDIIYAADAVFNYGVGFELFVNPKLSWYGSFVTDFSTAPKNESGQGFGFDVRHISFGASFGFGRSEFTLGISHASGSRLVPQFVDFDPGDGSITDPDKMVKLKVTRLKFIFGFSVDF